MPFHLTTTFAKTRLAPTPSGYLHLGNVYSFVLTLALARKADASVLLRIDDMDRQRAAPAFVESIFETLNFLHLPWNEGPRNAVDLAQQWSQTHRLPLYNRALQHLQQDGHLYACTCSRTEILSTSKDGGYPGSCRNKGLPLNTPGAALRIKTPDEVGLVVQGLGEPQRINTLPASVRDFVVRKKDGFPAYQLCSVVDDLHFGIDLVVRGQDLWHSTLAQLWLSTLLPQNSFAQTVFVHHPLITDPSGEKLSKSAGSTSVHGLRKEGASAETVFVRLAEWLGLEEKTRTWEELGERLLEG